MMLLSFLIFQICLHLPSSSSITRQISDFHEKTSYYGIHPGLIEANHFAVVVTDEVCSESVNMNGKIIGVLYR